MPIMALNKVLVVLVALVLIGHIMIPLINSLLVFIHYPAEE